MGHTLVAKMMHDHHHQDDTPVKESRTIGGAVIGAASANWRIGAASASFLNNLQTRGVKTLNKLTSWGPSNRPSNKMVCTEPTPDAPDLDRSTFWDNVRHCKDVYKRCLETEKQRNITLTEPFRPQSEGWTGADDVILLNKSSLHKSLDKSKKKALTLDANKDGWMSREIFRDLLKEIGLQSQDIDVIVQKCPKEFQGIANGEQRILYGPILLALEQRSSWRTVVVPNPSFGFSNAESKFWDDELWKETCACPRDCCLCDESWKEA